MEQLRSIREKLSWEMLAFFILYLIAAVILVSVYFPTRNKSKDLVLQLDELAQNEQNLLLMVKQRSQLEVQKAETEDGLNTIKRKIPSQYDLADVLEAVEQVAAHYGLTLDRLDHVPLIAGKTDGTGVIPLSLSVQGDHRVFAYLLHIGELFPSLKLTAMDLGYLGEGSFQLEARADLKVFIMEKAPLTPLQLLEFAQPKEEDLNLAGFGLPFEVVGQYLLGEVQILGIVTDRSQSSALLAKDGIKKWVKVGDHVGDAKVIAISQGQVWLNLDGVTLKLNLRG